MAHPILRCNALLGGTDMQTHLADLMRQRGLTYASIAQRTGLQARTIRMIATGETPIDRISVGTARQLAGALGVTTAELIEPAQAQPGDASISRSERLSRAVRQVMWAGAAPADYPSPVEAADDPLAHVEPADFFSGAEAIDGDRA